MEEPWILGIGASHNGAICLLQGDRIAVAVQEERLVRYKRTRVFGGRQSLALNYCLDCAGITIDDISRIVLCAQTANTSPEHAVALHPLVHRARQPIPVSTISHHLGHAIGAFATSGFSEAAVLVVDGNGSPAADLSVAERDSIVGPVTAVDETISMYHASGTSVTPIEKHLMQEYWLAGETGMPRYGSLGGMYAAVGLQIFGPPALDTAGKVMGLAPYGTPTTPAEDFWAVDGDRFVYRDVVPRRFPQDERWPANRTVYQDLAASVQSALEEALMLLARRLRRRTGSANLCYAGGVALNSVANERLLRDAGFERMYVMPAAEDSGTSIGAAYAGLWSLTNRNTRRRLDRDAMGRVYTESEIAPAVAQAPAIRGVALSACGVIDATVDRLVAGQIVGWFQGRSELGPRALGQRSILADPRGADMKDRLNRRVKHRESFRPFAPVLPLDRVSDWFELNGAPPDSPHMLRVVRFREDKRALVPAVVHVDGTGRLQTVTPERDSRLHELLRAFEARTGVPILLNTSFNVAGEPIVETPDDALWCLLYTGLDCCVLGDQLVVKKQGYESLLDLYIRAETSWVSFVTPTVDGRVVPAPDEFVEPVRLPVETPISAARAAAATIEAMARDRGGAYATYETRTRWGRVAHVTEGNLLSIVKRFDGRLTARAVLASLVADGARIEEAWFVRLVGRLRRAGIVSVHENPLVG